MIDAKGILARARWLSVAWPTDPTYTIIASDLRDLVAEIERLTAQPPIHHAVLAVAKLVRRIEELEAENENLGYELMGDDA